MPERRREIGNRIFTTDAFPIPGPEFSIRRNGTNAHLEYDYYFHAQDPVALLLVETWTQPAFQEAHCQTEIFAKLQALKVRFCEGVTIDKFND